ncbi:CU044_5270 family protein [Streptomyces griseoviridis]|uniref:CU044_5270 family protein n=1 Tax=Streptomyces griseoviridis TaxID=45398 RepID=A0A918GIK1_STRGD|nr:CU044_5270 family protein [Streptomyces niveoruber]GGS38607.1 hypothetical protein GCM10010238_30130 [Streptomyces niveoruber]
MNATGNGPDRAPRHHGAEGAGREETDRDPLLRLLPPPPERDLPAERHFHHKDRLMHLIDNDRAREPRPSRSRPFLRRPALWTPLAATALAGVLAVTLTTTGDDRPTPPGGGAAVLLQQVAEVAARTEATAVRDDQYVYVKSLSAGAELEEDGTYRAAGEPAEREVWWSQDPAPAKTVGLIHENGSYFPVNELVPPGSEGVPAGLDRPTYTWLSTLPTDPDRLLERLYDLTDPDDGQEKAQAVFDTIGDLLSETYMPPRNAAALYRAAAKIPGVTRETDAEDAAGRHGYGIRRTDTRAATATEWVFAPDTLIYLGERTYLTRDTTSGKAGQTLEENAVLTRGVVDAYRARPDSPTDPA